MRTVMVGLIVVLPLVQAFGGDEKECAAPKDAKTGMVDQSPYKFKHSAWTSNENGQIVIGHCVSNASSARLFIEWKKTSVSGYCEPSDILLNIVPIPFSAAERQSELWYGARPEKRDVICYLPTGVNNSKRNEDEDEQLPEGPFSARVQYEDARPLKSRIRIGVGTKGAEKGAPMDLTFVSDVTELGSSGQLLYRIAWEGTTKGQKIPLDVYFEFDKEVAYRIPRTTLGKDDPLAGGLVVDTKRGLQRRALAFISELPPRFLLTPISFVAPDSGEKEPIARAMVSIYLPEK